MSTYYVVFGGMFQGLYDNWSDVVDVWKKQSGGPKCVKRYKSKIMAEGALAQYISIREPDDKNIVSILTKIGVYGRKKRNNNAVQCEPTVEVIEKIFSDGIMMTSSSRMPRRKLRKLLNRTDMEVVSDDGNVVLLKRNTMYCFFETDYVDKHTPYHVQERELIKMRASGKLSALSWDVVDTMLSSGAYDVVCIFEDMIHLQYWTDGLWHNNRYNIEIAPAKPIIIDKWNPLPPSRAEFFKKFENMDIK